MNLLYALSGLAYLRWEPGEGLHEYNTLQYSGKGNTRQDKKQVLQQQLI